MKAHGIMQNKQVNKFNLNIDIFKIRKNFNMIVFPFIWQIFLQNKYKSEKYKSKTFLMKN